MCNERCEHRADVIMQHEVGDFVELRRLSIDDDEPRIVAFGGQREARRWPNHQR